MSNGMIGEEDVEMKGLEDDEKKTDSKEVDLDLDKFGGTEVKQGSTKPVFEKVTAATVLDAKLRTTSERVERETKAGESQVFYPVFLSVTMQTRVEGNQTDLYENFGGGRLFVSESKGEKRFWVGENSALGRVLKLLKDNFDFKGTLKEIPALLLGKKVGIKTEETKVQDKIYTKNMIQVVYPE